MVLPLCGIAAIFVARAVVAQAPLDVARDAAAPTPKPPPAASASTATAVAAAPPDSPRAPDHQDDGSEYEPPPVAPTASAAPPPRPIARPELPFKDGMIRLPGARFTMGTADKHSAPNERPPHAITVAPFWMDKTEVTVSAYRACVTTRACAPLTNKNPTCTFGMNDPQLPVACVNWKDADAFCRAVGKRLPREAEWEYAARGTNGVRYPWGGGPNCTAAVTLMHESTSRSCSGRRPAKVGAHPAGASMFGVQDMTGNVEEWTADWYVENLAEGAAPRSGASHVLRGGGWLSTPSMSRTTSRNWGSSVEAGPNIGFRCAKNVSPEP